MMLLTICMMMMVMVVIVMIMVMRIQSDAQECMKYSGSGSEHFKLRSRGTPKTLGDHYRGDYEL